MPREFDAHSRRPARWSWRASVLVLLLAALTLSSAAQAERKPEKKVDVAAAPASEGRSDGLAEWMPSLAISWGAYSQSIDGQTLSTASPLQQGTGDSLITTMFQFEGKLHTPLEFDVVTQPRIFLSAGVQIPLAKELIAQRIDESFERDLNPIGFGLNCPDTLPSPSPGGPADTCSLSIRNRVTVDAAWYTGVGVDLTLPFLEKQFHIAPAFEYYGLAAHTIGDFQRSSSGAQLDDLVETANVVGNSKIYHGVSPSLSLSVDLLDEGSWRWSMFLQTRVVFLLTDPLTSAATELGTDRITFISELDNFIAQGTAGIQVYWTGKGRRR